MMISATLAVSNRKSIFRFIEWFTWAHTDDDIMTESRKFVRSMTQNRKSITAIFTIKRVL